MHPHHDEAKKSMQAKVKSMVGSHKDHEHPHDKGMRLACGGMAEGGPVNPATDNVPPPLPMAKGSVTRPIEHRIVDIGPGGKEYNVKTSPGWKD